MKSILLAGSIALLHACTGQPAGTAGKEVANTTTMSGTHTADTSGGVVYFSYDNGATWQDKSRGLPPSARLSPGSIAASDEALALVTKEHGVYFFDFGANRWVPVSSEEQLIRNNPGALAFYRNRLYAGTQQGGVLVSEDGGQTWRPLNKGLDNRTIRRLAVLDHQLYVGTNDGFYSLTESEDGWAPEMTAPGLQVNGATLLGNKLYLATNQGAYKATRGQKDWKLVLKDRALHHIAADERTVYAMVYNELLSSADKGASWQNIQYGLPPRLYTFQVVKKGGRLFAGQWDGVYRKDSGEGQWTLSGKGLPAHFSAIHLSVFKDLLIVGCAARKLRPGVTIDQ